MTGENQSGKEDLMELSKRQLECVKRVIQGLSTKEIAKTLNISPRTVETHLNILRVKLKARNRIHLCQIVISLFPHSFAEPILPFEKTVAQGKQEC